MASDDRDRTFEKALARQLRSSASADAKAFAGAPADPSGEFCPDPETLAAYHEGSLSPEERNLWKQHVVSCDHCQLVLAHLATPLDIPVHPETNENVLVIEQGVSSPSTASPAPLARPSPLHTLRWLWLVPVGAIAATLIAWVSLEEKKQSPLSVPPSVEVAEKRESPVTVPSAKTARAVPLERKEKDQPAALTARGSQGASSPGALASKESQNQLELTQQAPSQHAATPAHGPFLSQQKQEQQIGRIAAGIAGAADQKKFDAQSTRNEDGRAAGSLALKAPATQTPPPPSEPTFLADGSVPAPSTDKLAPPRSAPRSEANLSPSKSKAESLDAISALAGSVEISADRESYSNAREMMRAAALKRAPVFWAPGGKQAWRIGPAGSLEHSQDKGLNWIPQISGVYTDLLSGSAPSAKVCWIVGASGTILRTTDGGTHWIKLDSPVTNDLTGIRATDDMQAWISFVPDLRTALVKIYQTTDGGRTWSSAPSQ
ncbi:MAG TPA: hypothetical protein VNU23_02130 [Candidatus Cybelea sp.]|jgi:hypothetical protein|nr:hypothetical protein [Candidatus Cybelea sp.]